jgi:signal transduction histidine kinase
MDRIWHSVAFRLALICGALVIASVFLFSTVFYFATIGVMARTIDGKINAISNRLTDDAQTHGLNSVAQRIEHTLTDGVDSDTEILLLTDPNGLKLAGNIAAWSDRNAPLNQMIDRVVMRSSGLSPSRVFLHRLNDGALLIVGRDMHDINEIRILISRAVLIGGVLAVLLAVIGTLIFRKEIEKRISSIRHATIDIEAGNLSRRIPVSGTPDEFDRLSADINRMLDRIQHLMEGVRHVSNIIAHNLRTPLGLIRGHLEESMRGPRDTEKLEAAGEFAIEEIDNLITVLEKLLQIAEAESSTRRQPFGQVSIHEVVTNLLELYDAAAEELGVSIVADIKGDLYIAGDKDLLAGILANLIDNALKYAGTPAIIKISAIKHGDFISLIVQDNGPGIPVEERLKVIQKFYRFNRQTRGSGLGLSIVAAFTQLHNGSMDIEDAEPGFRVRITLPIGASQTLPNGNEISPI